MPGAGPPDAARDAAALAEGLLSAPPGTCCASLRVCSEGQGLALSCLRSDTEEGAALRVPVSGRTEGGCAASPTLGDACFSDRSVLLCPAALLSVRPLRQSCARPAWLPAEKVEEGAGVGVVHTWLSPRTDSGEAVKKFTTSDTIWERLQSIM